MRTIKYRVVEGEGERERKRERKTVVFKMAASGCLGHQEGPSCRMEGNSEVPASR